MIVVPNYNTAMNPNQLTTSIDRSPSIEIPSSAWTALSEHGDSTTAIILSFAVLFGSLAGLVGAIASLVRATR